jgi:hypothetical protein
MRTSAFIGSWLFAGVLQVAHAAHPLITDDAGTQDTGNHQIEVNTDRYNAHATKSHTRIGEFTYAYGVHDNLDAFASLPFTLTSPKGANDAVIGLKWRFFESNQISLALKPEAWLTSGNVNRGLGNGRTGAAVTFIGAYDAAPWQLLANIAMEFPRYALVADREAKRTALWRTSIAALCAIDARWKLVADTGISRNADRAGSQHPAFMLAGVVYSPNPQLDLDAGIRVNRRCSPCDEGRRQFGVGATWRF